MAARETDTPNPEPLSRMASTLNSLVPVSKTGTPNPESLSGMAGTPSPKRLSSHKAGTPNPQLLRHRGASETQGRECGALVVPWLSELQKSLRGHGDIKPYINPISNPPISRDIFSRERAKGPDSFCFPSSSPSSSSLLL